MNAPNIGYIIGGGLREGLRVRLEVPADQVQEGSFVVCDSGRWRYYGLVTDLQLGATDPRFADEKGDRIKSLAIRAALLGHTLFTTLTLYPTLMLDRGPEPGEPGYAEYQVKRERGEVGPQPVKTVPAHHVPVRLASAGDVAEIFSGDFIIGYTIEQDHPVNLDLKRFIKRSSGIFGATGTGKSFLTRIVLAGLMSQDAAAALVFDMHNEYAFDDTDADRGVRVWGLKSLFGEKVQVAGLGAGARVGSHNPDFTLELSLRDFTPDDILLLGTTLNLRETVPAVLGALRRTFRDDWFARFMALEPNKTVTEVDAGGRERTVPAADSVEGWAQDNNIHPASALALHRNLKQIYERPYVRDNPATDAVSAIIDKLEHGRHVILSFGEYDRELDYLLVSNLLTRRIREHWVARTERHKGFGEAAPRPLVITVEEAHKLLSPALSSQTAFGIIARELRKYYVTLLVVDQRPSGIDDEVMSQLGTRITGWLGDEDDIRAVLTGLAGRDQLRGMLARLQEKEEVLLLGWGVRMPIPVRSRRYDQAFYDAVRGRPAREETVADHNAALFGE